MLGRLEACLTQYRSTLLVLALMLLVLLSAISVIYSSYKARQHFSVLQQSYRETVRLEEEWGRLLLEQSTWASHDRIENMASKVLGMVPPQASDIVVVAR